MPKQPKIDQSKFHFEYKTWSYQNVNRVVTACFAFRADEFNDYIALRKKAVADGKPMPPLQLDDGKLYLAGPNEPMLQASAIYTSDPHLPKKLRKIKAKGLCVKKLWNNELMKEWQL